MAILQDQIYNQKIMCGFGCWVMLERIGLESLPTQIFPQSIENFHMLDL